MKTQVNWVYYGGTQQTANIIYIKFQVNIFLILSSQKIISILFKEK